MDIQAGDLVTCKYKDGTVIKEVAKNEDDVSRLKQKPVIKIERPVYYEVFVEEKKELLTEEEKEFLKQYIKIIESLKNGQVINIRKQSSWIILILNSIYEYQAEIGSKFKNMEDCKTYSLLELGLEGN